MQAGDLNKRITIKRVTYSSDSLNSQKEVLEDKYKNILASVTIGYVQRSDLPNIKCYDNTFSIGIRTQYKIESSDLIEMKGKIYSIISINDITDRVFTTFKITERNE